MVPSSMRLDRDRFRGCLLGGAVGDALGAPVEFMTAAMILQRFGSRGITDFADAYGGIGTITDDTQLTLFTAEGLLHGWIRGEGDFARTGARAYLRWMKTQGEPPPLDIDEPGWLVGSRELHHRRAPGAACLAALRSMRVLGAPAENSSKGCGGVMRVAPVGLFAAALDRAGEPFDAWRWGAELAALTHGHPTGVLSAAAFALMIREIALGQPLEQSLGIVREALAGTRDGGEVLLALDHAQRLADDGSAMEPSEAVARLGQGWIAEEALAIAVYVTLVARDYRHGVILAVNHGGDSDSNGAIAGNLLGALYGVAQIPVEWLVRLELRSVIEAIADDLFSPLNGEVSDELRARYSG